MGTRTITMANTNPKLAMLEPTTLLKARSGKPSMADLTLTISSGAEVAKETTVIPIMILGILSRSESPTAALSNQCPPATRRANPRTMNSRFNEGRL